MRRTAVSFLFLTLSMATGILFLATQPRQLSGVIIEEVEPDVAGRTKTQKGDVFNAWSCGPATHRFNSAFDFYALDTNPERYGCGKVITVHGQRGKQYQNWRLGQDGWGPGLGGFTIRPVMEKPLEQLYQAGLAAQNPRDTAVYWQRIFAQADRPSLKVWILIRIARLHVEAKDWDTADQAYQRAVDYARNAVPAVVSETLYQWAASRRSGGFYAIATHLYELSYSQSRAPTPTLSTVKCLIGLGSTYLRRWDAESLSRAKDLLGKAVSTGQKIGPDNVLFATALSDLGSAEYRLGNLSRAEEYLLHSLAITERLVPSTDDHANALNNIAAVVEQQGNLARARQYYSHAAAILESINPAGLHTAICMHNLGNVAQRSGQFDLAKQYFTASLAIKQRLAPGTLSEAVTLINLAKTEYAAGDVRTAGRYFHDSSEILQKVSPNSLALAAAFKGLGDIADYHHTSNLAENFYGRALTILNDVAPNGTERSDVLVALASIARRQHQTRAGRLYEQALDCLDSQLLRVGGSPEVRSEYRAANTRYYETYVTYLLDMGNAAQAFTTIERFRSRTLLEMLLRAKVDIYRGVDPLQVQEKRSLEQALQIKSVTLHEIPPINQLVFSN
jgi:tetratricopeptide (TPR) repeat protein